MLALCCYSIKRVFKVSVPVHWVDGRRDASTVRPEGKPSLTKLKVSGIYIYIYIYIYTHTWRRPLAVECEPSCTRLDSDCVTSLHSAKGGVVEARCSRLRFWFESEIQSVSQKSECPACCSTCARHPLHPSLPSIQGAGARPARGRRLQPRRHPHRQRAAAL